MKLSEEQSISAVDFGIVVARALALVAWVLAAERIVGLITTYQIERVSPHNDFLQYLLLGPACMDGVIALVGLLLWFRADRFGRMADRDKSPSTLKVSGESLLNGLRVGIALTLIAPQLPALLDYFMRVVNPKVLYAPTVHLNWTTIISHLVIAAALLLWPRSKRKTAESTYISE